MKSFFTLVLAFSLTASSAFAQNELIINTPTFAELCAPLLITWSGGTGPYAISIGDGGSPNSPPLLTLPLTNATSVTYLVNIQRTLLVLSLRDATGEVVQSAPFSEQGTDTSCLTSSSVSFGSTGAPGASSTGQTTGPAPTTTQLTPSTSAHTAQTSAASGTSKTGTGTAASASPSKSAGASRVSVQVAAAGVVGAALIALLG